jgi:hypothetical protein
VVEGDEYDTAFFDKRPKFLHYRPDTAILTSVEFDHADIYRDLDHVKEASACSWRPSPPTACDRALGRRERARRRPRAACDGVSTAPASRGTAASLGTSTPTRAR